MPTHCSLKNEHQNIIDPGVQDHTTQFQAVLYLSGRGGGGGVGFKPP